MALGRACPSQRRVALGGAESKKKGGPKMNPKFTYFQKKGVQMVTKTARATTIVVVVTMYVINATCGFINKHSSKASRKNSIENKLEEI